ncbi:glycosyltransferase family 2 protein [Stenotrophomonas maltophilia]|nr:glycosyltransferase family 2 protein [Stenotrophomonas sp. SKA14]KOQ77955.1 glycosyltransferase [Stenotrophomonas maltophilia]MBH1543522.1 glycosyltransferase family 2 protein [Stenotrophomonas maltophilia]MBN4982361.1 glycosyltransferase family 2 protein [Stenotrophomonas maltophilia]
MVDGINERAAQTTEVSVVIPVYGCRNCLEELVERIGVALRPVCEAYEIILVDDNSPDQSWPRIRELSERHPAVRGLRLSRNFGQHAAISAGLQYAIGERVVVMDCDLQDVPEEIPNLLAALEGDVEVVLGQRVDRQDTWFKRTGSMLFYRTLGWLTDTRYDHTTANFGAYSRKVIDALNDMPETDRFLPLLVRWTGFNTTKVAVSHGMRTEGKSSYSFGKLLQMASRIALSFSDKPLRLVMSAALIIAAVAAGFAIFSVYRYSAGDVRVAGFTSIIASIWLVGSIIMGCIGVLGLYLGRVHGETKRRPRYLVWQDTRK